MKMRITNVGAILLVAALSAAGQTNQELKAEIDVLKQGQAAILTELAEIKKLLAPRQQAAPEPFRPVELRLDGAHPLGEPSAKVTLVEFTDYQCPFCRRHAQQVLPNILADYVKTGKVRYVIREFPLTQIHPRAARASEAALCAGDQGRYWEMHGKLFSEQNRLADEDLLAHAESIGLDLDRFKGCLEEGRHRARVEADTAAGAKAGVAGTPSFLLGLTDPADPDKFTATELLQGALPYPQFQAAIDKLLAGGAKADAAQGR
jgi:protein-disulfide isomerase